MKCILLCAGYATRLFPLTENFPKALLEIEKGKPLLNYILEEVNTIDEVSEIYVVTNNRYNDHFEEWSKTVISEKPIKVINDNTNNNDDRLGAIGDISYTINLENINEDVLIIAGDTLFDYKLKDLVSYYNKIKQPIVACKKIDDIEVLKRCATVTLNEENRITSLVEKSNNPESDIVAFATYLYPKEVLKHINSYLEEGNNPDAPGYLAEYLYKKMPVHAYLFDGECFDVGTHESLKEVRELYNNKINS